MVTLSRTDDQGPALGSWWSRAEPLQQQGGHQVERVCRSVFIATIWSCWCIHKCPAIPVLLYRFLSDDSSLEYKYYKLKLAEMQRMSQNLPGADQKPMAAECAVRAMLYSRAVRSLKKRLLPGRRRGLLRAQGLRGCKVRRATTGTQTLLSSGTRLKHHGRQAPGSLQGKPPQPDGNDAAKDCPPDPAGPSPRDPSPEASGPSPKPAGVDVSEAPQTSSPCLSTDGECSLLSPSSGPQPQCSSIPRALCRDRWLQWAGLGSRQQRKGPGQNGTHTGTLSPLASSRGWL